VQILDAFAKSTFPNVKNWFSRKRGQCWQLMLSKKICLKIMMVPNQNLTAKKIWMFSSDRIKKLDRIDSFKTIMSKNAQRCWSSKVKNVVSWWLPKHEIRKFWRLTLSKKQKPKLSKFDLPIYTYTTGMFFIPQISGPKQWKSMQLQNSIAIFWE